MCNRVRRGSWDNKKPRNLDVKSKCKAAGGEEIADSRNKCVKNLGTAAETLQKCLIKSTSPQLLR